MKASAILFAAVALIASCSPSKSTTPDQPPPTQVSPDGDASTDVPPTDPPGTTPPSGTEDAGPTPTQAACIVDCENLHPTGKTLATAIDTCWKASCDPSCTFMPDANGKENVGHNADGGTCSSEVRTPSPTCSNCTVTSCCKAWDGCFTNDDCIALNECSLGCFTKFPDAGQ